MNPLRFLRLWRLWWADALWLCSTLLVVGYLSLSGVAPSFTVLEAGWVWLSLLGVRYAAKNTAAETAGRRITLARKLNGGRLIVLNGAVRKSRLILFCLVDCLVLGIYSATPPAIRPGLVWLPAVQLMLLVGALTLITYLSKIQRESLLSLVRAMDAERPYFDEHAAGEHPG
jgi:hypothetical protein